MAESFVAVTETTAETTAETEDRLLEEWVGDFLIDHLQQQGIDGSQPYTAASLAEQYGAQPRWHGLLSVWLDFLVQQQRLEPGDPDNTYRISPSERGKTPGYMTGASGQLRPIADALVSYHGTLAAILRGERAAHTLLEHPVWSPECLAALSPGTQALTSSLSRLIQALSQRWGRAVQVIELGARSGVAAGYLLATLSPGQISYIGLDESQEMVLRSRERFAPLVHAQVGHAQSRRWQPETIADLAHTADIILLSHALHRYTDQSDVLNTVCQLAAPAALGYITEFSHASPLALISTQLLTAQPERSLSLRSPRQWLEQFSQTPLKLESQDHIAHQYRFMLRCPEQIKQPDLPRLHQALSEQLPGYMVPKRLFILPSFPLTANGKIDHQSLQAYCSHALELDETEGKGTGTPPQGAAEQAVATLWHNLLGEAGYHRQSDFFQAGGDSLLATRLIGALEQQGYQASLSDLFDYPTLAAFAATLHRSSETTGETTAGTAGQAPITPDTASRYQPFALTEVQQAYWVGRQPGFTLGGIGSQFFVEFDVGRLDIDKLEQVWNRLIERHDMLRAVVQHGQQQVLAQVPHFTITPHRLTNQTDVLALREKLAHQVRDPAQWPVCDLQVAMLPDDHAYLYLCLDNLLLDGLSMQILLAELEQGYRYPHLTRPPLTVTFRDYQQHMTQQPANEASKAYWLQRIGTLPPAPQLPLLCVPEKIHQPRFIRLSDQLTAGEWQSLKAQAKQAQLTPSALLLSAYAAVLSAWSREPSLTLHLTLFDRHPLHPQINQVLGDFTSLLLLAWQPEPGWLDSAQALQRRLWQDLTHRDVSAVWVMRQLAMRRQEASTSMPVVFTSALGFEEDRFLAHQSWLKPRWGISQTPQVWLDHQVYESEGELRFNWDAVEALFDPHHLHAMFNAYTRLLRQLATHPQDWSLPLAALVDRPKMLQDSDHRSAGLRVSAPRHSQHQPEDLKTATAASEPAQDDDQALVQLICELFREISHSPIQATQNFFDAGATSLMLVQLHIRLQNVHQQHVHQQNVNQQNVNQQQEPAISVHPEVTDLFAYPSPALLARYLQARNPHGQTSSAPADAKQKPVRLAQRQQNAMRRRRHRS
ncbi:condensation domain-containing protein [Vibrio sp. PP-XX7]